MAYTINKTDGSIFATVPDGIMDTTTSSLTLIGKNYESYGDALNENYVRLLESHANTTAPTAPHLGQLWWNSTDGVLTVYDGTEFKPIGTSVIAATAPPAPDVGDQWYNSTTNQLNVYNGTEHVIVGPLYSTTEGVSGAIVETITSGAGTVDHVVTKLYVGNDVVGIISKDAIFTPDVAIPGFTTVSPGLHMSSVTPNIIGTASNAGNALLFDNLNSTQFLRSDAPDITSETLGILNDGGLTIGADSDMLLTVTGTGDCEIRNATQDREIAFYVNDGGINTKVLWMGGLTTEHPQVFAPVDPLDIANMDYVDSSILAATQTGAQIKVLYEGEANTNAFDDAAVTKLAGIELNATNSESFTAGAGNLAIIDLDSSQTITSTLTGNVSLTSTNRAAGLKVDVFFEASAADRIVTLNASWKSFGETSPIIIPSGKWLALSLTCLGTTETDVMVAAVLEN